MIIFVYRGVLHQTPTNESDAKPNDSEGGKKRAVYSS